MSMKLASLYYGEDFTSKTSSFIEFYVSLRIESIENKINEKRFFKQEKIVGLVSQDSWMTSLQRDRSSSIFRQVQF